MKSNNIEKNLCQKTFWKFIITVGIFTISTLVIFILITNILNAMDFQWLYLRDSNTYYFLKNLFNFVYRFSFPIIALIWLFGILILLYRLINNIFSYISDLRIASNKLLNKDIENIKLPPELNEIENQMNRLKYEAEKNERLARDNEQRKNDLIVYLAHDLKTPLTSIIGYLELLKEAPELPLEQRKKYIDITLDKSYRLEDLMNEFFEIARFNDTKIVLMKKNLNIKFMLEQIVDEFYPIVNEQGKNFKIVCDDKIMCYADPDKFSRALNNVIKNAISYSFENTNIDIFVKQEDNGLINISIENEGYTIPQDKLNSIFEKFYRIDNSRSTNNGGAGLGLAIAKEIITLHNGTIDASSEDNKTKFKITIPIIQNKI